MPIRIGDVFLLVFVLLALCVGLGHRLRPKESLGVSVAENSRSSSQIVKQSVPMDSPSVESQPSDRALEPQQTGRKVNVAGIWGTFECVEYRFDNQLEVHVHQIDETGRMLERSRIHREPFEDVVDKYVGVTSW